MMLNIMDDPFEGLGDFEPKHFVHVGLADRRNYLSNSDADSPYAVQVFLPKGDALVLEIKPEPGQPRRNPFSYLVKVLDQELWQIRTLVMRATEPLLIQ